MPLPRHKSFFSCNLLFLVLVLLVAGCPRQVRDEGQQLLRAEKLLAKAKAEGAADFAPVELRQAQEKLAMARGEYDAGTRLAGQWLAEESEASSRLARYKTLAAKQRRQVQKTRAELDRMRRELLHESP